MTGTAEALRSGGDSLLNAERKQSFPGIPLKMDTVGADEEGSQGPKNGKYRLPPDFDEAEESLYFQKIVNTYKSYKVYAYHRLIKTVDYLNSLSPSHQEKLANYRIHLEDIRKCISANHELMKSIVGDVCHMFENIDYRNNETEDTAAKRQTRPTNIDTDKTHTVLKQIVREWSEDGLAERTMSFKPIMDEIEERFGQALDRSSVSILVPGAGLGRLPYDIAVKGYTCQGNEYSLIMLFASNFILNKCQGCNLYTIYPWVHQYHNNWTARDQIRSVRFPDANPSAIPPGADFSMAAGNFTDIYTEKNKWDSVVTCFFIDTAHNVVSYIETIYNILKPGGFWINLGPLLYHFADMPNENSIEPSYDVLKEVILSFGFEMVKEQLGIKCNYTQNPESMLSYEYKTVFFVCKKSN